MVDFRCFRKTHQINSAHLFMQYFVFMLKRNFFQRIRATVIFMSISLVCYFYIIHDNQNDDNNSIMEPFPTNILDMNTSTYAPILNSKSHNFHTILLWTSLFSNNYWHQESYFNSSTIVSCSSTHQCQFTRHKEKLSQSSLVAFHLYDTNRYELPDRSELKTRNQNWVFITGESPINFYYQNPSYFPNALDAYFDRSISYKYDSFFSVFSPKMTTKKLNPTLFNATYEEIEHQLNVKSLESKKRPILWVVSNCVTFSQREKYVEKLREFIPVDVHGRCGIPCSKEAYHACNFNLNNYYFYLAFENTRCNSYITEKFWNIISDKNHRLVPIVMGANDNDYRRVAPKNSYIHVNNYKSPKELSQYLYDLMNNSDKYLEYLRWREHTKIETNGSYQWANLLCPLCQMSYESQLTLDDRLNFSAWYNPANECHYEDVELFRKCKQTNLKFWMSWAHNIRCP